MPAAPRLSCTIDHLVITAPSLEAGADYIRETLNVELSAGGAHARMGTHNRLLRLGDCVYLEVIAIDPAAPVPPRTRWFGLDALATDAKPRLATWVARVNDIRAAAADSPALFGEIESMSRGGLEWLITVPRDGSLVCDGVMPPLIEWHSDAHPATRLADTGCKLIALEARHPDADRISAALHAINCEGALNLRRGDRAELVAVIETPSRRRAL